MADLIVTVAGATSDSSRDVVVVPCTSCGTAVRRRRSQLRDGRNTYCSRACYEPTKLGRSTHNAGARAMVSVPCEQCGKLRTGQPSQIKRHRFCSQACAGKFYSGTNAPAWRGGVTPARKALFNSPAYQQWRRAVLERDAGRCRWCDRDGRRSYRRLEIHHIIPVAMAPSRVFDPANSVTLCKSHHDETRGREELFAHELAMIIGQPLASEPSSSNHGRPPLITSADRLRALYWGEGLTSDGVGIRLGVSGDCVLKHMRRLGIDRRPAVRRAA